MSTEREPIYWRGELIGYIENPTKFPALWRGRWLPGESPITHDFLETLKRGYPVWVEYGNSAPRDMAQIKQVPTVEVELFLDIEDEQTLYVNPFKDNGPSV